MGKLYEVREYEILMSNETYASENGYRYIEAQTFEELLKFIRSFSADHGEADILDFLRVGYKRGIGDIVTVKNYVGLIQLRNGSRIQILPKIMLSQSTENETATTKKIFLKMLQSMKDFPSKVISDSSMNTADMDLYEIFINMYLQEAWKLVKHGLKSAYVPQEDNLRFCKGKLLISQNIRQNAAHQERFYVSYDEFHVNRPENRLIKATLLKLQKQTVSAENAKKIRQLLMSFENVEPSINYAKDFAGVVSDRNMKDYSVLLAWSKVFLMNKSFTTFAGPENARALLFPMEKVYESYVAQQMKRVFTPAGWDVLAQDKGYYLFEEPTKKFALRPDLVLSRNGKAIIMDTKWKRLFDNQRMNYGISQSDMYQMYAYSKKYGTSDVWLLYPANEEMYNHVPIQFESRDNNGHTTVHVFFVNLEDMQSSMEQLMSLVTT